MTLIERCTDWIREHSLAGEGVVITSRQRVCYPEVTGYFIPTLLSLGERMLARQYARWLCRVQQPDGSFAGAGSSEGFAFDTGQVVRGWVELVGGQPELEGPLRRACDWLIESSDPRTGRLRVPRPGGAWSLGTRGEVSEAIHLYALVPLLRAASVLDEPRYARFVERALDSYRKDVTLCDFERPESLTHFYAYVQEALLDLGCDDLARRGMDAVARRQQPNGAVPAYADVAWVCSTGLAQLAAIWFRLGERERGRAALSFLEQLQNPSGGFFGSYGVGADYFPGEEISWAAKYAIEAAQASIAAHFDETVADYAPTIDAHDGRARTLLERLAPLQPKRILDAGCGKGRYAALLKRHFPEARITALDVSAEMLSHVPAGIETVQHGMLDLPFPARSFDAVVCIEALEHAVHTETALRELVRVLRPGGALVLIDKNRAKQGTLETERWEKWFDVDETLDLLGGLGLKARAEFIGYDGHDADGLFVCWSGTLGD